MVKKQPAMQQKKGTRVGSLGEEEPLEEGTDNTFQYSCLQNPMDRRAWRLFPYGHKESTRLKQFSTHTSFFYFLV